MRRIMAMVILKITGGDVQDAAGSIQLCTGQKAGIVYWSMQAMLFLVKP